ncbi:MAG TPA: accessory factor UbiK family protein [Candidatus Tenderia sp.]|nr:accessory factor UbiK family protein [Candidatus Tenderia sp.]
MMDPKILDDLAKKLADSVPGGLKDLQSDMEKNFHAVLQSAFNRMNLVTREEFEVQTALLERTRTKLDELAKQVANMEQNNRDSGGS